ncbi:MULTISPECIES: type IV pilus secretin family protein [Cyanophyceae]|uniref:Type II and III secretion system protein n=1 Tax=Chroococcidiopsis thermalis (strain PCC 7203) TaxID=251229 RepID=K9U1C7_CHRTP|nr:type II and III secretion system protein [Chroococcidiopsis thermalis PCC 7203]PSB41121.1 AMIN domain-containing protein [Cyanosarcina cf. burmensis CCALA 770]
MRVEYLNFTQSRNRTVKQLQGSNILFIGVAVALVAAPPVWAKPAKVTAVKLDPTNNGLNVVLETSTTARPQVLTSQQGKTLVADISNAQLNLPEGQDFRQTKPASGIDSVVVTRLDSNSIRLMVTGTTNAPSGQMQRNGQGVTFSVSSTPERIAQANPAPTSSTTFKPGQSVTVQKPLFPNPEITVDGKPVPPSPMRGNQAEPPFLPRAVAPPVGDMAISNTDASPALIDLGSQERVPRLVLRDAPVREVLSLLARAAGLNLAYTTATPQGQQGQPAPTAPGAGGAEGPRVTLDIQDESVQDVFNHVLRITGLQANREGRTIFVGPRLPNDARNLVTRSYRLNQVTVGVALNFLVAMGAESAVSRERTITSVQAVPVGGGQAPATQTQTSTETRIETQRIDFQDSTPLLRGLEVVGDERTNSVTLIGSPKQVQVASAQLIQLDSRRRQVAINVKIADINLLATEDINTSFSFGLGDTFFQNSRGIGGIINFGVRNPASGTSFNGSPPGFARQFLSRLQAQITSGNAKVLTDPTLIVQEGQQAAVNLTQEVVGNVTRTISQGTGGLGQDTTTIQKERVGLTVGIKIERVDDNGFVALSVAPTVRAVQDQYEDPTGNLIALINERSLTSGLIRLRDNQTLILSGIIQESDRTSVDKVPILGDIPILGALFRSTNKQNQRQEVIVLLTPQIIDDSERSSSMGYNYNPSPDARQMLERSQNRKVQTPNSNR